MPISLDDITLKDEKVVLPLHHLVALLRQNGFTIRPDDYIEMLKVTEKFGSEHIEDLAPRFCPLIATSPDEQERFYKVFNEYKKQSEIESIPPSRVWWNKIKNQIIENRKYWLAGFVIIVAAIILYSILQPSATKLNANFTISNLSSVDNSFRVGDTIILDASTFFQDKASAKEVQFLWNTGNGFIEDSSSITMVLQKEGSLDVQLKIRSATHTIGDSIKSEYIRICPAVIVPELSYEKQYLVGQVLELNAGNFQKSNAFNHAYWKVNGIKYRAPNKDTISLRLRLDTTGIYKISLVGLYNLNGTESGGCSFMLPLEDIIVREGNNYMLNTTYTGEDVSGFLKNEVNPWLTWLLLVPALITTLWTIFRWIRRKKVEETKIDESLLFPGKKPPYETPFENKDFNLVQPELNFRKIFQSFRQKAEDELISFNVPKSIYHTIRTGGVPELVFTNKLRYNDYLILIDATHAKSMQIHLFDFLARLLHEEAICVERFYYTGNFEKIFNESLPNGITLKQLSERYKNYTVIMIGSGHQLIYAPYPLLEKNITHVLHEWEHKAILTPIPYKDWGKKEKLIAEQFVLLPADIYGQLKIIEAIREKQLSQEKYLSSATGFYKISGYDFEIIEEVEVYLDDEVLFQWLCATAVFHKLRWEILVEIGKEICTRYKQPEKINFTNLLKLCRINWMDEGAFPADLRLELLKKLTPENEILARETLLRMMQYPDTYFGSGYIFDEEKEIQKITSRFLLYAHDPDQFSTYAEDTQKFRNLWQRDHLWDTPQKVYLDNDNPIHWTSLLHHGAKIIGVRDFFNLQERKEKQADLKQLRRNILIAASFLLLLALLHLFKSSLPQDSIFISSKAQSSALFTIAVKNRIACEESQAIQTVEGTIRTPDGIHRTLTFEKGSMSKDTGQFYLASLELPITNGQSQSLLQLNWNERDKASYPVQLSNNKMEVSISACAVPKRYHVTIYYNDSSRRRDAVWYANILTDAGYYIDSILYKRFFESSHIDYYNRTDKAIADSMVALLSVNEQSFGTNEYTAVLNDNTANYRKQFDVMINLTNMTTAVTNTANAARLPSSVTEIWRGTTNNRLIAINANSGMIYYSTGNKRTYGTYRIEEVWRQANDVYQVITRADKQFAVFLFRNIQPGSFELSVCQTRYNTKDEAKTINENSCDPFNRMSYYFESNQARIFTNFGTSNLTVNQQNKLTKIIRPVINNSKDASVTITYSSNRFYPQRPVTASAINNILRRAGVRTENVTINNNNQFTGTPFDRNYIQITVKQTRLPDQTKPDEPARKEVENYLMNIPLDEKNYPTQYVRKNWMSELRTAINSLQKDRNSKLRFVAYYDNYSSPKEAQEKINNLRNFLQKELGKLPASQILYETRENVSNQAQQNQNVSSTSQLRQIVVYSIRSEPEQRTQSKY